MSTVPGPGTPAPANNAKTLTLKSDSGSYARPSAGGNAADPMASANGPFVSSATYPAVTEAPANKVPGAGAYSKPAPADTGSPNMGHGATQILSGISGPGDMNNDGDAL
jgi:hypothetical protein